MLNDKKALVLSSEKQQIMEVPSCKLRAVVVSDLSWPWADAGQAYAGRTWVPPGESVQIFPAPPASPRSRSLLTADCSWDSGRPPHPQLLCFCCGVGLTPSLPSPSAALTCATEQCRCQVHEPGASSQELGPGQLLGISASS